MVVRHETPALLRYHHPYPSPALSLPTLPVVIIRVSTPADVQLTLQFVRRFHLPFAIRGGGHSKKTPEIQIRCCGIGHQADVTA